MKNINNYIILDINPKYYGFGDDYYSISNFFQYDGIIKIKEIFRLYRSNNLDNKKNLINGLFFILVFIYIINIYFMVLQMNLEYL